MKKLILLAMLAVGAMVIGTTSEAKADHLRGCGPSYGGSYYGGYGYVPSYYTRVYSAPVYGYGYAPVNSFGYAYPTTGFYYGSPGLSISFGSGYRGYSSGYSGYSTGGFGAGRSYYHGHHHH